MEKCVKMHMNLQQFLAPNERDITLRETLIDVL